MSTDKQDTALAEALDMMCPVQVNDNGEASTGEVKRLAESLDEICQLPVTENGEDSQCHGEGSPCRGTDSDATKRAPTESDAPPADGELPPHPHYFSSNDEVSKLQVSTRIGDNVFIPISEVKEILDLVVRGLYEHIKDTGRLSVVVTQSKPDVWHRDKESKAEQKTLAETNQWIIDGYGSDDIVNARADHGVCRHQPIPGAILTVQDVGADPRTADSWYAKNGLRAYCGMRLTSLPECTLCALWVGNGPLPTDDAFVLTETSLNDIMVRVDAMVEKLVHGILRMEEISQAQATIDRQTREKRYVSHEITNQLAPLVMMSEADDCIDNNLLLNLLDAVFSILKDPSFAVSNLENKMEYIVFKPWIEELKFVTKQLSTKAGVEMTSSFESTLPDNAELKFDPIKLRQALLNLIINARKFTSAGSITWVTRVLPCESSPEKALIEMKVMDTGCGIKAADIPLVTDMFVQVGLRETRNFGSGIGLAVTKAVVESLHGGTLTIDSEVDVGTTITLRIDSDYRIPLLTK